MTKGVADAAIHDEQFAVGAMIETVPVPPARLAVGRKLRPASAQALQLISIRARAAQRVDEHANLHPRARLLAQRIDKLRFQLALGPDKRLEVNAVLRCGDVR